MGQINFAESFFYGETRENFYIEPMVKKAWAAELEVLKIIENICKKYNIRYFASYGTLLGAVRHKGFIPWDDDIDIYFTRRDWIIFSSHFDELPSSFRVLNYVDDNDFRNLCVRIVNETHIPLQGEYLSYFHGYPYIAGVDIEILDNASDNDEDDTMQLDILNIIIRTEAMLYVGNNDETLEKDKFSQIIENISMIEELCKTKFNDRQSLSVQLFRLFDNLSQIYNDEVTDRLQGSLYRIIYDKNCIFASKSFEDALEVPFECTTIWIPKGYREVLVKLYGDDYMTPIKGTGEHDYPSYKKQEKALKEYFISIEK